MIGQSSREDMDCYGVWPWIAGFVLGAGLVFIMFQFANPIS